MIKYTYKEIKLGILRPHPIRGKDALVDKPVVDALVDSIEDVGMLHAPIVCKAPRKKWRGYWFITGGNRIAAALKDRSRGKIMCRVVKCDDEEAREILLRENLDRSHLSSEQQSAMRQELAQVIENREGAGKVALGKAEHVANVAKATGFSERTIERDERFREQLSPGALKALHRREITVKDAEDLCRMSEEHQEEELADIRSRRSETRGRGHHDRFLHDVPGDEPKPTRPRSLRNRICSFVSAFNALVETQLQPILDSKEDVAALAHVHPMDVELLAYPLRKIKWFLEHLPPGHVQDLPLAAGLVHVSVPPVEVAREDGEERSVSDTPPQASLVKPAGARKPAHKSSHPVIPMGRSKARQRASC